MAQSSFVRNEMLPPKAPPPSQAGIIGWMRQKLFSGPINSVATVLTIVLVVSVLMFLLPWIFVPTWGADSLSECRDILKELGMTGHFAGACWGVIRVRWLQLLFGFYPHEYYWRPILALILLFVALAPVLFSQRVPRKLLVVSLLFPFIMPWLLWGGSFWTPVVVFLGFAIGVGASVFVTRRYGSLGGSISAVVAAVLWWYFLAGPAASALNGILPLGLDPVKSRAFGGFMLSVTIGITAIGFSLPIGIILALGRQSDMLFVRSLSVGFIEFIRGVPLITLLFVASTLLNIFMPPGTNFDIIMRVIIMATLFASAYMAEVIRGGLAAVPKGQYEGADSLGLDYWQKQRLIIMPQALKIAIPGIVSTFISLFKDTTLVSIIGLLDPLGLSTAIRADSDWNGIIWELYGFIALLFFVVCFSMSRYSMYLERKLQTGH